MPKAIDLKTKPSLFRFARAAMAADTSRPQFEVDGGMYGAGVIRGVSVITEGEALGHGMWIDSTMVQQTHDAIVAAGDKGVKSRFTHPGMCSDGLGKHLGRIANSRIEGKSVIGDLHFTQSAHKTPEGDLADYVSALVQEDSSAAGLSIVFDRDYQAESKMLIENGAVISNDADGYQCIDVSGFKSPDPANTQNYPHARLSSLRAVDVVDEPAANDGMFDSNPIARDAEAALAYALGLEKTAPEAEELGGVNIERATEFLSRFFANRGLVVVRESELKAGAQYTNDNHCKTTGSDFHESIDEIAAAMKPQGEGAGEAAHPAPLSTAPQLLTRDALTVELSRFTSRFGAEHGVEWFTGGKTWEQALELHCDAISARNSELSEQLRSLNDRLQSMSIGAEPLPVAGLQKEEKKTLSAMMNPSQAK